MTLHVIFYTLVYLVTDQWVIEQCCADTDSGRTGNNEFQCIFCASDTALANDRNIMLSANLVYLMYF